MGKMQIFIYF